VTLATTKSREALAVNRDKVVQLRLSALERKAWDTAAKAAGLKLSDWIRRRVNGETTIVVPPAPKKRAK
jgi:hypothetical protein